MSEALVSACEALLFVAGEPLTVPEIAAAAEVDVSPSAARAWCSTAPVPATG